MAKKIGGLTEAQAKALLKWQLVRERVPGPWATYQKLIDLGYLRVAGGTVPSEPKGWLLVTDKGKEWCDANHLEVIL